MMSHAHRWVMLAATPASDAVCRTCGERRRFTGGVRADATATIPNDRTWVTPATRYQRSGNAASLAVRRRRG